MDSFGSRLISGSGTPQRGANGNSDELLDVAPSMSMHNDNQNGQFDSSQLFASRQGQLAPTLQDDQQAAARRQPRQPAQPPQLRQTLGAGQQQQQLAGALRPRQQLPDQRELLARQQSLLMQGQQQPNQQNGQQQQHQSGERFQRLRTGPSTFEQFPRPQTGGQSQQQAPANNLQQQQNNQRLQFNGLPTLSAFDLSSLANLANNQPSQPFGGQGNQNNQLLQTTFRRVTPGQLQQLNNQQQRANSNNNLQPPSVPVSAFFEGATSSNRAPQANQVPSSGQQQQQQPFNNGNNQPATELPLIRQVFRPAPDPANEEQANNNRPENVNSVEPNNQVRTTSSGRPTPPPLFVPARQNPQPAAGRPGRPLETGFSPIQPFGSGGSSVPRPLADVFFEPSPSQQRQAAPRQQQQQQTQPQFQSPQANLNRQMLQPQPIRTPLPPPQESLNFPSGGDQPQLQPLPQLQQGRKPVVRRPSQRPHVPLATTSTTTGASRDQVRTSDVIRLASTAIQAASEGLAAVVAASASATPSAQSGLNNQFESTTIGAGQPSASTFESAQSGSSQPATTTTTQATTTTTSSSTPTTTGASQNFAPTTELGPLTSGARRTIGPLRSSANFFQTLTSAATSSPSSFSPALPINQAVAASGGRRRIPVRANTATTPSLLASQQQQQRQQTTTTPVSVAQSSQLPLTSPVTATTGTSSTTSATASSQGPASSQTPLVRRPEIEEFYETIGGNGFSPLTSGSTTQIDGFGAPSRPRLTTTPSRPSNRNQEQQPPVATTQPITTQSTSTGSRGSDATATDAPVDAERMPTTTTDLYGSRLTNIGGSGASNGGNQEQSSSAASRGSDEQLNQLQRVRAENANSNPNDLRQPPMAASNSVVSSGDSSQQVPGAPAEKQPVMVPVTYMTTLTYLTTVLHGTHTLETSHESVEKSTKLASLNAQLMDQIEHRLPLIEPTATVSLSSKTKGRGTTIINLKSAVSAYNQELVEALGAAGGGTGPQVQQQQQQQAQVQPTQVPSQQQASVFVAGGQQQQFQQVPFNRQQQQGNRLRPQQALVRPSRTVDLAELADVRKSLMTEYVYLYTMRPIDQPDQLLATSVRSELVPGATLSEAELMNRLAGSNAAAGRAGGLIDSNGMLRMMEPASGNGAGAGGAQINLGSTIGKDTPMTVTEVNMNVATYVKFDAISNVLVEMANVKPTRLAGEPDNSAAPGQDGQLAPKSTHHGHPQHQLDTSFNVHLTLGNALDQLDQQTAPKQTPALGGDQASSSPAPTTLPTIKMDDLLRSSTPPSDNTNNNNGNAADQLRLGSTAAAAAAAASSPSPSASSQLARSQLRSRVASSRFRSSLQTLQPMRQSAAAAAASGSSQDGAIAPSSSPTLAATETSASLVPPPSGQARQRPNKSRISRPPSQQNRSSQQVDSSDQIGSSATTSPTIATTTATGTRFSKPRFVVVTRTGQFGIRASAISSLAAAAAAAASSAAPAEADLAASQTSPAQVAPTVRVSSRFSKIPNRFRGASQSIQVTRVPQVAPSVQVTSIQPASAPAPDTTSASSSSPSAAGSESSPRTTPSAPNTSSSNQQQQQQQADLNGSSSTTAAASGTTGKPNERQPLADSNEKAASAGIKLDGSASVIVTYFTTTTHTIPFELNSETVFTTIEETNSRIATEYMSDLSSHFIEPTPTAQLPVIAQTAAPTLPAGAPQFPARTTPTSGTTTGSASSQQASTTTTTTATSSDGSTASTSATSSSAGGSDEQQSSSPSVTTTTSGPSGSGSTDASDSTRQQQEAQRTPPIEPSFVIALNTRTYFTTFTYFTTYSAGSESQTIKSSESTTSNIITETVTSQVIAPSQSASAGSVGGESTLFAAPQPSASQSPPAVEPMETRTLLSTMTYYGTVYNGTQTSLTPILDISTKLVTMSNSLQQQSSSRADFNLDSDLLAASSTLAPQLQPTATLRADQQASSTASVLDSSPVPTPPLGSGPDKITRTKSMYTTLTHYITFYSGTKTQLSTIQEISPTVLTEYIDKTLFEQQQQESSSSSSSVLLVVPTVAPSLVLMDSVQPSQSPSQPPQTTTTTTTTSSSESSPQETTASSSSGGSSEPTQTTTSSSSTSSSSSSSTTTTGSSSSTGSTNNSESSIDSVSVSHPEAPNVENQSASGQQQQDAKVLASSAGEQRDSDQSAEAKQAAGETGGNKQTPNIIELSDLIASNSSQSGRVALAGNLGAAIKDIVQLLAGNKTSAGQQQQQQQYLGDGLGQQRHSSQNDANSQTSTTTTSGSPSTEQQQQSSSSSGSDHSQAQTTQQTGAPTTRSRPPARVFGNKRNEQQQLASQQLQGSITSPSLASTTASTATTTFDDATSAGPQSTQRPTPELASSTGSGSANRQQQQQQPQAAATIFFGDDAGDERRKQIKTVWPGAQSTLFVTSIEPSTRYLTMTTTKVYYTRDAPLTITSSFTSVIAPRTFVSTIMGTRTLVNQLNGPQQTALPGAPGGQPRSSSAGSSPQANNSSSSSSANRPADRQNAAVADRYKQQKQQQQQVEQQQKKQQQLAAKQQQQQQQAAAAAAAAAKAKEQQQQQQLAGANINQCQPACKASLNEVCKFTPNSETSGAQGTFACACRPGYYLMLNSVGQRTCQEVQSYVIMLRLLQIGDQQVAFKRELQNKSSAEFKQFSRIVKEHVKRAYMTSDLVRDRYVGSDIINYARSMGVSPAGGTATTKTIAANASQHQQQLDPLSAGIIVNMTVHLQPPASAATTLSSGANEVAQLDESMLKEELTKKLNMRQAAALAAAAAAASSSTSASTASDQASSATSGASSLAPANGNQTQSDQVTQPSNATASSALDEMLPNPNALFLADVEQVQDLDECANPALNDCHEGAVCTNEPGSYRCDCRDYPDLNPLNPGRQCANEVKSCDYCNNRGDCIRVPSLLPPTPPTHSSGNSSSSSAAPTSSAGRSQAYSTVCQCHRIYLGRRCEINGLLLATLLPIAAILLIISVCLIIYCCRRWRKRSSLSKGFRNIGGTFGPNILGSTLDRKAMLESSSETSDTNQRHHHHQQQQQHGPHAHHHGHALRGATGQYESHQSHLQAHQDHNHHHHHHHHGLGLSEAPSSSSQESSPRQMVRHASSSGGGAGQQLLEGGVMPPSASSAGSYLHHLSPSAAAAVAAQAPSSLGAAYCSSMQPQIVIPRARHNQVNYAVHRGQVYMW